MTMSQDLKNKLNNWLNNRFNNVKELELFTPKFRNKQIQVFSQTSICSLDSVDNTVEQIDVTVTVRKIKGQEKRFVIINLSADTRNDARQEFYFF